jgi:hypothetical protein
MVRPRRPGPAVRTNGDRLAQARERFLTSEAVETDQVRNTILASWQRSRHWNVAADRVQLRYVRDPDLDSPLIRSALPVLRALRDHLDGQPISVILTDPAGLVLTRMTGDADFERHLDRVLLVPGFSYAEEWVGTNGIGTALEGGRPMHVFGHEHYAENLENLACAAVPIHHPITGKTVGAVNLTCWCRDAGPLLIALAKSTTDQIQQALLADAGAGEFALTREYLRACRRGAGIVVAFNNDTVMMNEHARRVLDATAQSVLLSHAAETLGTLAAGHAATSVVDLPNGSTSQLQCRPVHAEGRLAGGIPALSPNELSLLAGVVVLVLAWRTVLGRAGWADALAGAASFGVIWVTGSRTGLLMLLAAVALMAVHLRRPRVGLVVGGLVLGALSSLLGTYLPDGLVPFRDAIVFSLPVAILIVRPQGLLGAATGEARI